MGIYTLSRGKGYGKIQGNIKVLVGYVRLGGDRCVGVNASLCNSVLFDVRGGKVILLITHTLAFIAGMAFMYLVFFVVCFIWSGFKPG